MLTADWESNSGSDKKSGEFNCFITAGNIMQVLANTASTSSTRTFKFG
jgi:hypothetical protein